MPPKILRRLSTSFGASQLLLAAGEILLRTQVADSATTPFRTSEVPDLAREFRPNFTTLYNGFEIDFNSAAGQQRLLGPGTSPGSDGQASGPEDRLPPPE